MPIAAIGTWTWHASREGRGNSHKGRQSFFHLSELRIRPMTPETEQNATAGHTGVHVDPILAKAQSLCRTIAYRDLGETPLYLLAQSKLPVGLSTQHHYAFTHPRADLMYRDHIAPWFGRGPCAVINDIGIVEDFAPEDHEYAIIGIVLHELAHILDRPALFDEQDCDDPDRLLFDAMVLAEASKHPFRSDVPMYFGHGPSFVRIAIHLAYRATQAGFDIKPAGIVATHRLGLSPTAAYEDALGDEPHRCLDSGFRELLATEPPTEFTQLWAADMHRYQVRFSKPQENYT